MSDLIPIREKQIRLAWNVIGRKDRDGNPIAAGSWFPDTPTFSEQLRIIMEAGVESYGPRSHWIEESKF